jgi:hypothetical protein
LPKRKIVTGDGQGDLGAGKGRTACGKKPTGQDRYSSDPIKRGARSGLTTIPAAVPSSARQLSSPGNFEVVMIGVVDLAEQHPLPLLQNIE